MKINSWATNWSLTCLKTPQFVHSIPGMASLRSSIEMQTACTFMNCPFVGCVLGHGCPNATFVFTIYYMDAVATTLGVFATKHFTQENVKHGSTTKLLVILNHLLIRSKQNRNTIDLILKF